jgi:hypothetical protein
VQRTISEPAVPIAIPIASERAGPRAVEPFAHMESTLAIKLLRENKEWSYIQFDKLINII